MKHLIEKETEMLTAQKAMREAMIAQWPVGASVMVLLSRTQRVPTRAHVVGHDKNYLIVKLETNRQPVRDIHFNNVL